MICLQKMLITFIFLPLGPKIRMMKFDSFSMISTFTKIIKILIIYSEISCGEELLKRFVGAEPC